MRTPSYVMPRVLWPAWIEELERIAHAVHVSEDADLAIANFVVMLKKKKKNTGCYKFVIQNCILQENWS